MKQPSDFTELLAALASQGAKPLRPLPLSGDAGGNSSVDRLVEQLNLAQPTAEGRNGGSGGLDVLLAQLGQVAANGREQAETLRRNTTAIEHSTGTTAADSGGDSLKLLTSVVSGGIVPLVSGLFKLFGGSDDPAPQPLVKFALPQAVDAEAGVSRNGAVSLIDHDESGRIRSTSAAPQITLQIQALDSRSILERSDDIARAVKDAMLHSNSLNDVVVDL